MTSPVVMRHDLVKQALKASPDRKDLFSQLSPSLTASGWGKREVFGKDTGGRSAFLLPFCICVFFRFSSSHLRKK